MLRFAQHDKVINLHTFGLPAREDTILRKDELN